jgi:phage I-like protein
MFTASSARVQTGPGRTLVLRVALGDLELDDKRSCWAHVARLGEWRGHPAGPFQIEQRHLASIVDCFERSKSDELVFDYEHASTGEGAEAPASGWVKQIEIRGDDLWAFVEWTERAAGYIRAGEYRYASCVIFFDRPDKESGEPVPARLHSIALTNVPFMDGLTAIALTEKVGPAIALTDSKEKRVIEKKIISEAIKAAPTESMTEEQWTAWISAWLGAAKKPDAPAPDKAPVDASDKAPKRVALADSARSLLQQIASLLKVEIDADGDLFGAVYSALSALQSAAQVESMLTSAPAAMSDAAKALARSMRALSDSITAGDTPGNGVKQMADGDVIPPGAGGPSGDDVAAQAQAAVAARLIEASGMDAAGLLAALEANLGAVVAALKGEAVQAADAGGDATAMAATQTALKETTRKLALAETKLAALEPTVKSLSDRLAVRDKADADAARALRERTVETLVKSKQIPETARAAFVALGDKDPTAFAEQMKAFRVDLTDVPLGREASSQPDPRAGGPAAGELDEADPRVVALRAEWARKGFALTDSAIDPHRRMSAADRDAARTQRKARQDVHIRAALAAQGG